MIRVFNEKTTEFKKRQSPIPEFSWHTSERLEEITKSKHLDFSIRSLDPDKFSYPYHFHREAEEIFVILSGEITLRTQNGFQKLRTGDIVFFEAGATGAHQLYNHSDVPCRYLDIRTKTGIDICEYPDSRKINILPYQEIYESDSKVDYYKGENRVIEKWPKDIIENQD